jgi:hypothetical protein
MVSLIHFAKVLKVVSFSKFLHHFHFYDLSLNYPKKILHLAYIIKKPDMRFLRCCSYYSRWSFAQKDLNTVLFFEKETEINRQLIKKLSIITTTSNWFPSIKNDWNGATDSGEPYI